MSVRPVTVTAPSRLHFGMFSFGQAATRQFGGVGLMIDQPSTCLRFVPQDRFVVEGRLAERVSRVAQRMAEQRGWDALPGCRVEVVSTPPRHAGLGTGTQLALAVAAGLNACLGGDAGSAETLARWSGRGVRSAVGTYGFVHGGWICEAGKRAGEPLAPLVAQAAVPDRWRLVLDMSLAGSGLSGDAERQAFESLPAVEPAVTDTLCREVVLEMLPALKAADCDAFGESVYRFGRLAGQCFAACQGGSYASEALEQRVETLRGWGVAGVGQSSWGPTVFAVVEDAAAAEKLVRRIMREENVDRSRLLVAAPANRGAMVGME